MQSVIPVKNAIGGLLAAASWPTSAPAITWVGASEGEDFARTPERIYFAGVRDLAENQPTMGGNRVDEDYTLGIDIDVAMAGDDEQATELRAWALYEVVRRTLVTNHILITNPGSLQVELRGRTVNQTNIMAPGLWIVRVSVDQTVNALVFAP